MRAEGFYFSSDVLYEGLEQSKLQFLIIKRFEKIFNYSIFLQFLVIKTADPDSLEILDPDPQN